MGKLGEEVNGFGFRIGSFDEERVETPEDYTAITLHQGLLLYHPSGNQTSQSSLPVKMDKHLTVSPKTFIVIKGYVIIQPLFRVSG